MEDERLPGIGAVALTVADIDRAVEFYERVIGLQPQEASSALSRFGDGEATIVELYGEPDAPPRPPGTAGLFHLAILVPTRSDLSAALRRVAANGWRLTGASDHLVSEALYLNDPEGNGIEIYRDRPRSEWRYADGELQMATLPLDLEGLLSEGDGAGPPPVAAVPGTRIGHVHLNVADLGDSERFYSDRLGFEPSVRSYPGALFVAADGYHHHLGLNTWAGSGVPPAPEGSRGLRHFELHSPNQTGEGLERDPSGIGVLVRGAGSASR